MRFPIRPVSGRWATWLERPFTRYFWRDPSVILRDDATPEQFRAAMSAIYVGETIKITGAQRHSAADDLIIDNVDTTGAVIVDIGASDGSTSVDLIRRLGDFGAYVISDLYLVVGARHSGSRTFLFDASGDCILVIGRRFLAWPGQSRFVRALYAASIRSALRSDAPEQDVLLLNPEARALVAADSRVTHRQHDVFEPWIEPRPSVIKIANVLRRLYFSDADILRALGVILGSLDEGAHFLIVDNPRIKRMPARAALYRRTQGRFEEIARTENAPEIADLIAQVSTPVRAPSFDEPVAVANGDEDERDLTPIG